MMLKPQISVTNQSAFIVKIQQLDLSPLVYQLMHSPDAEGWSYEQASEAIAAYRRFLFLIHCYPEQPLVPTEAIDRVWHHHILDTQKYAQDCQFLFNRFIHHFPYFGVRGESDRHQWQRAVVQTRALFEEHFGGDIDVSSDTADYTDCQPLWVAAAMARPA